MQFIYREEKTIALENKHYCMIITLTVIIVIDLDDTVSLSF